MDDVRALPYAGSSAHCVRIRQVRMSNCRNAEFRCVALSHCRHWIATRNRARSWPSTPTRSVSPLRAATC